MTRCLLSLVVCSAIVLFGTGVSAWRPPGSFFKRHSTQGNVKVDSPDSLVEEADEVKFVPHIGLMAASGATALITIGIDVAANILTGKKLNEVQGIRESFISEAEGKLGRVRNLSVALDNITTSYVKDAHAFGILLSTERHPDALKPFEVYKNVESIDTDRMHSVLREVLMMAASKGKTAVFNYNKFAQSVKAASVTSAITGVFIHRAHTVGVAPNMFFRAITKSSTFLSLSTFVGPVFGFVQNLVKAGISVANFKATQQRCESMVETYKTEKDFLLRDIDYTMCRFYGNQLQLLAQESAELDKVPAESLSSNLQASFTKLRDHFRASQQAISNEFHATCDGFTKLKRLGDPIREVWAADPFSMKHLAEGEKIVKVSVNHQPVPIIHRKAPLVSHLGYYQPNAEQATAKPSFSAKRNWYMGDHLWEPVTSMNQLLFSNKRSKHILAVNDLAYDNGETDNLGTLGNSPHHIIMESREANRMRDMRLYFRQFCDSLAGKLTPAQQQRCKVLDDMPLLDCRSWCRAEREQSRCPVAPYYHNFISGWTTRKFISKIAGCVVPTTKQAPVLGLFYNREAGAPIVDIKMGSDIPTSTDTSSCPTDQTGSVNCTSSDNGVSDCCLKKPEDTCSIEPACDQVASASDSASDWDLFDAKSTWSQPEGVGMADKKAWKLVAPVLAETSRAGCPKLYMDVWIQKDYSLPLPNGLLPLAGSAAPPAPSLLTKDRLAIHNAYSAITAPDRDFTAATQLETAEPTDTPSLTQSAHTQTAKKTVAANKHSHEKRQ